jgi:hypothetical protein
MEILAICPIPKKVTGLLEYKKEEPFINPVDGQKPCAPQDVAHPFGTKEETKKQGDTKTGSQIQSLGEKHRAKHDASVALIIEEQFTEVVSA